ncbi:hypothetical protein ACHHYP_12291 [Achlya hypogyna]|uniref:BZIP domain-containing protein n=1 Tax=Achlya hypogyna TaxID=1202772 RepID=A0A1V9YH74_ACHHY|nr:hypothetical protein ACHHYP_12291 [Achlya hypogyna]
MTETSESKRLRNRLKQKRHRDRFSAERDFLQAKLYMLRNTQRALLSKWAQAGEARRLAAAAAQSVMASRELKRQCHAIIMESRVMASWVAAYCNPPFTPKFAMTLAADAVARRNGLDWFTRHLYHNTDRVLHGFPPNGRSVAEPIALDPDSKYLELHCRYQRDVFLSLPETYNATRDAIWSILRGDTSRSFSEILDPEITKQIAPDMLYRRTAVCADESTYYACREFASENRVVFLFGNFGQDELQPTNTQWRSRLFWYVLERVAPHQTRFRMVWYNGPYVLGNEVLTWKDESAGMGLHVDEDDQAPFVAAIKAEAQPMFDDVVAAFDAALDGAEPKPFDCAAKI